MLASPPPPHSRIAADAAGFAAPIRGIIACEPIALGSAALSSLGCLVGCIMLAWMNNHGTRRWKRSARSIVGGDQPRVISTRVRLLKNSIPPSRASSRAYMRLAGGPPEAKLRRSGLLPDLVPSGAACRQRSHVLARPLDTRSLPPCSLLPAHERSPQMII